MKKDKIHIYDCETNQITEREMTEEEQLERNAEIAANKAAKEAKEQQEKQLRITKISAYQKLGMTNEEITAILGLTEDEARLLLGGN